MLQTETSFDICCTADWGKLKNNTVLIMGAMMGRAQSFNLQHEDCHFIVNSTTHRYHPAFHLVQSVKISSRESW